VRYRTWRRSTGSRPEAFDMRYRAIINIDFTDQVTNEYTRLKLALRESGSL
jgi:hypothetical protein